MPSLLALNVLEHELEACADFCRHEGLAIEVTAFAFPTGLDQDFSARVERHAAAVEGLPWISLHGPFLDLYPTSPDPAVVELCRKRHSKALQAACEIGASIYVAHLNSIPLIRNKNYRDRFAQAAVDFWLPFAEEAGKHEMTIVLENLWETDPHLQKRVVEQANHPCLKASFDNGHALVFSTERSAQWIEVLGEDLAHCHLHDNDGQYDHHWAVGEGREAWSELWDAVEQYASGVAMVLESDELEANRRSLNAIHRYRKTGSAV